MATRREKYEENNVQLVRVVVKLRKKVANLERQLIEHNRVAQNQHDENVVLKIKLTEKENYVKMMQSSAIDLISHNTMQIQKFLFKTGLKIPSRHQKPANVQTIGKESHINMKKEPEHGKGTSQHHCNEMPNSDQNKPIQLKVFQKLVDRTSSSLSKLSLVSNDERKNDSESSNINVQGKEQRKSLSMAGVMDDEIVSRSPIAKKQMYDAEVNESLRILKERKTGTSLAPVPDESNTQSYIDLDQAQVSTSNHSSVSLMSQTKVVRKRRSEIVPHLITPMKSLRSDTNVSRAHAEESDSQNGTANEHESKSNHSIKESIFQNVTIRKSRKSEINSHLFSPVEPTGSNTFLARSPTNMNVIQNKAKHPKRTRSSHTQESSNDADGHADKHQTRKRCSRTPTQSDREETPIADRSRRSQPSVDYTRYFLSKKRQE